jgi:hypothetical protein
MGIMSERPCADPVRRAEQEMGLQRQQEKRLRKNPVLKQTSPRLWVPLGATHISEGLNKAKIAKRKARITLAKVWDK